MKGALVNIIKSGVFVLGAFYFSIAGVQKLDDYIVSRNTNICNNSIFYRSREEVIQDMEREKARLGLEKIPIALEIVDEEGFSGSFSDDENGYLIKIDIDHFNKSVLRHEMKHAQRYHQGKIPLGEGKKVFKPKMLYEEWVAGSYALERAKED